MCSYDDWPAVSAPVGAAPTPHPRRRTAHNRELSRIRNISDKLAPGRVGGKVPAHQIGAVGLIRAAQRGGAVGPGWTADRLRQPPLSQCQSRIRASPGQRGEGSRERRQPRVASETLSEVLIPASAYRLSGFRASRFFFRSVSRSESGWPPDPG